MPHIEQLAPHVADLIAAGEVVERPASVVVFTDGRGDFPPESAAQGIPVLWLFTEQGVQAPWGKAAWLGGGNGNEQK